MLSLPGHAQSIAAGKAPVAQPKLLSVSASSKTCWGRRVPATPQARSLSGSAGTRGAPHGAPFPPVASSRGFWITKQGAEVFSPQAPHTSPETLGACLPEPIGARLRGRPSHTVPSPVPSPSGCRTWNFVVSLAFGCLVVLEGGAGSRHSRIDPRGELGRPGATSFEPLSPLSPSLSGAPKVSLDLRTEVCVDKDDFGSLVRGREGTRFSGFLFSLFRPRHHGPKAQAGCFMGPQPQLGRSPVRGIEPHLRRRFPDSPATPGI
jgi:hypothetical protein